jgi:hypothetical protein
MTDPPSGPRSRPSPCWGDSAVWGRGGSSLLGARAARHFRRLPPSLGGGEPKPVLQEVTSLGERRQLDKLLTAQRRSAPITMTDLGVHDGAISVFTMAEIRRLAAPRARLRPHRIERFEMGLERAAQGGRAGLASLIGSWCTQPGHPSARCSLGTRSVLETVTTGQELRRCQTPFGRCGTALDGGQLPRRWRGRGAERGGDASERKWQGRISVKVRLLDTRHDGGGRGDGRRDPRWRTPSCSRAVPAGR